MIKAGKSIGYRLFGELPVCLERVASPERVKAEVARDVVGGADAVEGNGLQRRGEDDDAHKEDWVHLIFVQKHATSSQF